MTTRSSQSLKGLLPQHSVRGVRVHRSRRRSANRLDHAPHNHALSLNTICPYYTMFPLGFPITLLRKAQPRDQILDPFCGRGTTLFAARLHGLACVGIDSNPVAAAVAAAKLTHTTPERIAALAERILAEPDAPSDVPANPFWRHCYHPLTLRHVCHLRNHLIRSCKTDDEIALRALLLGILHGPQHKTTPTYLSNQMPRTYATKPEAAVRFWRRRRLTAPPRIDVLDAIRRRAHFTFANAPPPVPGEVHLGDARQTQRLLAGQRRVSWVITSPPYFGMRTYRPDQWLRNWFLGGPPWVDYSEEGQLSHHPERFAAELAAVWRSVARRCLPDARLVVRFGYLPSMPVDPRELLRSSIHLAEAGWRITRWIDAGNASNGKRQADQFEQRTGTASSELDLHARLET